MPAQRRTVFTAVAASALALGFAANQAAPALLGGDSSESTHTAQAVAPSTLPQPSPSATQSNPQPNPQSNPQPERTEPADRGNASREPEVVIPALGECVSGTKESFHSDPHEWSLTFMDHEYGLSQDYAPDDLVRVTKAGLDGVGYVRDLVVADLADMAEAAKAADAPIAVHSSYRSYAEQKSTYKRWAAQMGSDGAAVSSAREGHSEHQLGTAVDLRGAERWQAPWKDGDFGATKAGKWLAEHAWEYGFVMSFPPDSQDVTCYKYEPWHFRYVGKEVAAEVHEQDVTLREYLWVRAHTE